MRGSRRTVLALGCGAVTAGCLSIVGPDSDEVPTAGELESTLTDLERPETMIATVETRFDRDGSTRVVTDEIEAHLDGRTAVEGETEETTFRNVDDGERGWFYDVGRDRVAVMDSELTGESHIDYIYDEAKRYFDELEGRVLEATSLDGRPVYRVRFEPPPDETVERAITVLVGNTEFAIPLETEENETNEFQKRVDRIDVWFHRETLFPVKQIVRTDDETVEAVSTSLSLNEPVDDDRFAFDPPADALVEEHVFPYLDRYETIEDAETDAGISVPRPTDVPDRFDRAGAAVVDYPFDEELLEVSVRYASETTEGESIRIGACTGSRPFDVTGDSVTVDGASATLAESDLGTTIEWPCDDRTLYLFATESVARETALSVAESVDSDCEK